MKKIKLLTLVLLTISCGHKKDEPKKTVEKTTIEKAVSSKNENKEAINTAENAKKWLIENMDIYFNSKSSNFDTSGITTKTYTAYKVDAINVDLDTDGALSQTAFEQKWKSIYETKYAGIGTGFFISAEDFGKIKVSKCDLLSQNKGNYIFQTIITDTEFKTNYKRDIKIIASANSFLIDDVKEYN